VPEKNRMFLDVLEGDRRGHFSARGGTYWEDQTYSDQRVLLHIPKGFDPRRPALMIVFFHGNEATLTRDVRNRQAVPRQVAESGLNAVLVAPQFAVNALDSSAGRFWEPGVFTEFLNEAAERLTELYGDERARGAFHGAPVVIAAYSGGYNPAAFILHSGRADDRVRGLVLLDALFGEIDKFADWLARRPPAFFVSAFGKAARQENAALQRMLTERGVRFQSTLPASLARGSVAFIAANEEVKHVDFMTEGWVNDPLKVVLRRIAGFSRPAGAPAAATPKKK
jgi:pimeloyl-ACP methyl ester carboxylesterase